MASYPENLRRIVYFSEVVDSEALNLEVLQTLIHGARHFNAINSVTGMLWYDGKNFSQALEGPQAAIIDVMERIHKNPLHKNIHVVVDMITETAGFGDWALAFQAREFVDVEPPRAPPGKIYDVEDESGLPLRTIVKACLTVLLTIILFSVITGYHVL